MEKFLASFASRCKGMYPLTASAVVDNPAKAEYAFGPGTVEYRRGCIVRLEDKYHKTAVFIGSPKLGTEDEIDPWGSAFLIDCDTGSAGGKYLVTAHHLISEMPDAPFAIRFNKRGGGSRNFHIEYPKWVTHATDNTVDVAVHRIVVVPEWADVDLVPRYPTSLEDDRFASKNIGVGNRTYTVGLWKFLHGDKRNQAFVYSGHVGLVPQDQKVPVQGWLPAHRHNDPNNRVLVDAYLVEGQPLDGASGSPVFVRRTLGPRVIPPSTGKLKGYIEGSIWLLGLQSDAWSATAGIDYELPHEADRRTVVPRGVNAVVPSMKINEVLDHPDLKREREETKNAEIRAKLPMKTKLKVASSAPPASDVSPTHRERFTALLNAAAKTPPRDD